MEKKGKLTKRPHHNVKQDKGDEIIVKPKKVSKSASSPDRHHINVLNSKLNDSMEKISALEWEREKLQGQVIDMSETIKKLTKSLNHYKSIASTIQDKYQSEISNEQRKIKNMKIQHEAEILDKEKIILSQEDKIKQINRVLEFTENEGENVPKSKGSLLLDMLIFYENLGRVLNNDSANINIFEKTEEITKKIQLLIKEFENSPDIKKDITNQVIISQLKDILKYLDEVSTYSKDKEILKQGVMLVNDEFKEVLLGEGIEEIPTIGVKFNPNLHEAVEYVISDDFKEDHIIETLSNGYAINGKIIKKAQVKVCKK